MQPKQNILSVVKMKWFSSRWCEGEVLCPHVKCRMFIPLFCFPSQIPFYTRALQGPVIPGHWIQIKTSTVFLWLNVQGRFYSESVACFFWNRDRSQILTTALYYTLQTPLSWGKQLTVRSGTSAAHSLVKCVGFERFKKTLQPVFRRENIGGRNTEKDKKRLL